MHELVFTAHKVHTSPMNVHLTVTFAGPNEAHIIVSGFWDGGKTWRVRFAPPSGGDWNYQTSAPESRDTGLDKQTGNFTAQPASGNNPLFSHGGFLRVSLHGRYLTYSDGTPFFWLGDTWWFCPSTLCPIDSSSNPDIKSMFKDLVDTRRRQGFTVAQILFVEPKNAVSIPSLHPEKWTTDDIHYWHNVDRYFAYANKKGLLLAAGIGFARTLDTIDLKQLKLLWRYIIARYGAYAVTWIVTGEYNFSNVDNRIRKFMQLASFIKSIDPYKRAMSIHPWYSAAEKRQAWDKPWYDFIMLQGGHMTLAPVSLYSQAYDHKPPKPILESESNYEGIYNTDESRVRMTAYRAIQSGAFGYTYGSQGLWHPILNEKDKAASNWGRPTLWWKALARPGSDDMAHLHALYKSVEWWKLVPYPGAVFTIKRLSEENRILTKAEGTRLFVIYYPPNISASLKTLLLGTDPGATYSASWFNPRSGKTSPAQLARRLNNQMLPLPNRPGPSDWVLILRNKEKDGPR